MSALVSVSDITTTTPIHLTEAGAMLAASSPSTLPSLVAISLSLLFIGFCLGLFCMRILGFFHTSHEIRTMTRRLEVATLAKEKAERKNSDKTVFIANLSHEIRTPLNGLIGLIELIQHQKLDDKVKRHIDTVAKCSDELLYLLNDMLDVAKIEMGELKLEERVFNVEEELNDVLALLNPLAEKNRVALKWEADLASFGEVKGDSHRLRQVIANLVSNAIKFSKDSEVILRAHVKEDYRKRVVLRFEVEDHGPGIPKHILGELFMPFRQASDAIPRTFGGTGLGLAICRSIVLLMGGVIGVKSEVAKGSVFWCEIPFKLRKTKRQSLKDLAIVNHGRYVSLSYAKPVKVKLL